MKRAPNTLGAMVAPKPLPAPKAPPKMARPLGHPHKNLGEYLHPKKGC